MDTLTWSGREIHWWVAGRLTESPLFGTPFDRATRGVPMMTRDITTVRRLAARSG